MRTFISDLIPKIKRFSEKLDNLTLLTNQHWVVLNDSNDKIIYIFRTNNDLLISHNGKVEKAKWEYLGNSSLLIDKKNESYLLKHGFFDEDILALKVDNIDGYVFLVNENKSKRDLNSLEKIIEFLSEKYLVPESKRKVQIDNIQEFISYEIPEGNLEIEITPGLDSDFYNGRMALLNGETAPNGKYKIGFMWFIHIENGHTKKSSLF